MQHRFQIGIRILLLPVAAGLALAQTHAAPSSRAPGTTQGQPPANLRSIFASPFASKLASAATSTVSINPGGVVPVFSPNATISPGSWVSIYGNNLSTVPLAFWTGDYPTSLGNTTVTINNKPAYVEFVTPGQINVQAPDDTATGTVPVVVTNPMGSATTTVTLEPFGPSFCLLDASHVAAIIARPDGSGAQFSGTPGSYDIIGPTGSSLGYPTKAAKAGDTITIFGVGFGQTSPPFPAGQPFPANPALYTIPQSSNLSVTINGTPVPVGFAGLTLPGLFQFNVTIPSGLGTGDVPLSAIVGGVQTQPGVVISMQ